MRFSFSERNEVSKRSMFGEKIVAPEFCWVTCDECDNEGYVSETSLMELEDREPIKCTECQ